MTQEDSARWLDLQVERRRLLRDRSRIRRLEQVLTPGLPVDGDAPQARVRQPAMREVMDRLVDQLLVEKSDFFDGVCAKWQTLFPTVSARPGRFQNGRLFLYVRSSSALFSLRPKLTKMKKILAALPDAPRRFTLHLEIH